MSAFSENEVEMSSEDGYATAYETDSSSTGSEHVEHVDSSSTLDNLSAVIPTTRVFGASQGVHYLYPTFTGDVDEGFGDILTPQRPRNIQNPHSTPPVFPNGSRRLPQESPVRVLQ